MSSSIDRREFLEQVGLNTAAVVAGGFAATSRGYAANETLNIGCIGTGGRCRQLMQALGGMPGVRLGAVCDVYEGNLQEGLKLAAKDAAAFRHHEDLLAREDIDAVVIGTPDHWHVPIAVDACNAGKDVYVEKPLTHVPSEGQAIIDAQNRNQRIVQVGMQQRSMPHLQKALEVVRSGKLGEIRKVHLTWNRNTDRAPKKSYGITPDTVDWKRFLGNAPEQPFDEYRFRHWRWFWDFGGGLFTDLMVHYLDVAHWFLGLDHPARAVSIGNWFTNRDQWETPDTVQTLLQYEQPETQVYYEGTFYNARNAAMMEFMGSEATLYCDRGRYEVHPEPRRTFPYEELVLGTGPRGADFYDNPPGEVLHLSNWIECIRTRATPNAPAETGASAAAAAHLANQALRSGAAAQWTA
ncbi:MAG: Gfo/Idh/MocA family oxidoreductase [Candidatus Hydrogenedentes bacterium]|nr:Gfo/Idh/MocA family oxidoreductase [Candidatus Hydrogenedentota bacterium]MBI3119335.1 Gfo/Idh/MocA family oxidoreductase [Candidatus Hydrogenedentota bacterium]